MAIQEKGLCKSNVEDAFRGCHGITISGDQEIFRETRLIKGLKEIQWKEIQRYNDWCQECTGIYTVMSYLTPMKKVDEK